ncbi:MobB family relaxase [Galbibacter sp. PAP.153]|uniref:MobB family relaxase n=1 Tax=Galbibacter sp. PAP.153 TaxID=3104623 RepID=UPI00300A4DD2
MYVTISGQKTAGNFPQSVSGYAEYLEKENKGLSMEEKQYFFDQYEDGIEKQEVIKGIDENTAHLKKNEPRFYSITVNPAQGELKHLKNPKEDLKKYTRALMKSYVECFNREIDGRKLTIDDIKYYAKIEHIRYYKGTDTEVKANREHAGKVPKKRLKELQNKMDGLTKEFPYRLNGKTIVQGMRKPGNQSHIHIIVSRRDASNRISISPGSKYRASNVIINGKQVKRGFDRDRFFKRTERDFDQLFGYKRNYIERYKARKLLRHHPERYFLKVLNLPEHEKAIALRLLKRQNVPVTKIPIHKVQLALQAFKQVKRSIDTGIQSSSINY